MVEEYTKEIDGITYLGSATTMDYKVHLFFEDKKNKCILVHTTMSREQIQDGKSQGIEVLHYIHEEIVHSRHHCKVSDVDLPKKYMDDDRFRQSILPYIRRGKLSSLLNE
jgi:hypothetical protein